MKENKKFPRKKENINKHYHLHLLMIHEITQKRKKIIVESYLQGNYFLMCPNSAYSLRIRKKKLSL